MKLVVPALFLAAIFLCFGCGTDATDTAKACAQSNLIEQCPDNTFPELTASATSQCGGSGEGSLVTEGASVTGSCEGTGDCLVFCRFQDICTCGIETYGPEGVVCKEDCSCGNGTCDGDETPDNCAIDCAAVCVAGNERCNGNDRESCNLQGIWETLACADGTVCAESANPNDSTMKVATCQ